MKQILCRFNLGIANHKIYVSDGGSIQELASVELKDLSEALVAYAQEYDTNYIHIFGAKSFLEKIVTDIKTNYSNFIVEVN